MRLPAAMREKAVAFEKLAKPQALKSRQMCPGHALDAISAAVARTTSISAIRPTRQ